MARILHRLRRIAQLFDSNRRKPNLKNRVDKAIESAVIAYATEPPAHEQVRISNELRGCAVFLSLPLVCVQSGSGMIWRRSNSVCRQYTFYAGTIKGVGRIAAVPGK